MVALTLVFRDIVNLLIAWRISVISYFRFCFDCIDNWSTITNLCPLCQNEFQLITCVPVSYFSFCLGEYILLSNASETCVASVSVLPDLFANWSCILIFLCKMKMHVVYCQFHTASNLDAYELVTLGVWHYWNQQKWWGLGFQVSRLISIVLTCNKLILWIINNYWVLTLSQRWWLVCWRERQHTFLSILLHWWRCNCSLAYQLVLYVY